MLAALKSRDRAAVESALSEYIPNGALETALLNFPEVAPLLIEHGANFCRTNKYGPSVLILAIEHSNETALLILDKRFQIDELEFNFAIDMERDEFLSRAITTFKAHPLDVIEMSKSKFFSNSFPLSVAAIREREDFYRLSNYYSVPRSIYTEMLRYGDMYVLEQIVPDENFRRLVFALRNTQLNLDILTPDQMQTLKLCL